MAKTLTLYGTDSDLSAVKGDAGMLCEFAPDSPWLKATERYYRPDELLGSADDALNIAHSVVSKLIEHLGAIAGISSLAILEEPLLEQVSYCAQTLHLDRWICSQGFSACRFDSYSPWLDRLRQIKKLTGSKYDLTASMPLGQANWLQRGIVDLRKSIRRPSEFFRRVAPLWSRVLSAVFTRGGARKVPRGGIWFYSTAYNYTKIALEYEPYFPHKMNFLVEDADTGGKRLSEIGRDSYVIYAWSRAADVPSISEVRRAGQKITEAVTSVPLAADEDLLRTALLKSEWWDRFKKRILPFALFHGRALERWCDAVTPEMLVVGNAGWERSLLQSNSAEHITSLLLQHGIMHRVYAVADQPVTYFLLRGRFFQNLVNDRLRQKTILCNYPQKTDQALLRDRNAGRDILFITMPYDILPLFHRGDLRDILGCLLRVSCNLKRQLLIRVHPMESIFSYQKLVSEIQHEFGLSCNVVYSQGPNAEEILARSSVAVLYFSTMFLDCLTHGIPIISPDWHWFANKCHFKQAAIFNFASDLSDLERLVQLGIDGLLESRRTSLEDFLAPTQPEEISKVLSDLWQSRRRSHPSIAEVIPSH
jgi:hypothetical protein